MLTFSCMYCGKGITSVPRWPPHGDSVAFYQQTPEDTQMRPGAFNLRHRCPHCQKDYYIVWDDDPTGQGMTTEPHATVDTIRNEDYYKVKEVVDKTGTIWTALKQKLGFDQAMPEARRLCEKEWKAAFPASKGLGERSKLDLARTDFSHGIFLGDNGLLRGANFTEAKLDESIWIVSLLGGVSFQGASLRKAHLIAVLCEGASFRGADLSGAIIDRPIVGESSQPVDCSNANLEGATLRLVVNTPIVLTGARMNGCSVSFMASHVGTPKNREGEVAQGLTCFLSSLSDEQRSQIKCADGSKCFIATACYGSADCAEVRTLRCFRDQVLLTHVTGQVLTQLYYLLSPTLARWISARPWLTAFVRDRILAPFVKYVSSKNKMQPNKTPQLRR